MNGPLSGIRVLEIANWAAVPSTGALLGELGAEVVKIEPPTGDGMRGLMQAAANDDQGIDHAFQFSNRGKASVAIDLRTDAGRDLVLRLADVMDVVLLNLTNARRERLGLSVETIRSRNPRAIVGTFTGYGEAGPERDRPGFDLTAFFARSGLSASILGSDGGVPRWRAAQGDHMGGLALFGAVMAGLFQRESTGEGMAVSSSLLQSAAWSNAFDIGRAAADGRPATPRPRARAVNVSAEAYRCADDRWIQLSMAEPVRGWEVLCEVLDRPDLLADPRFVDVVQRFVNMEELVGIIAEAVAEHPSDALLRAITERGGAAELVQTSAEVAADPQVRALGLLRAVDHPSGELEVVGPPFLLGEPSSDDAVSAPETIEGFGRPGVDTRRVLADLVGLGDADIDALLAAGVVAEPDESAVEA